MGTKEKNVYNKLDTCVLLHTVIQRVRLCTANYHGNVISTIVLAVESMRTKPNVHFEKQVLVRYNFYPGIKIPITPH